MKNNKVSVYIAILGFLVGISIFIYYFALSDRAVLKSRIALAMDQNVEEVDMKKLTPFEWDNFYFFEPYASKENINAALGFNWGHESSGAEEYYLLVFVKDKKVVENIFVEKGFVEKYYNQK